MLKLRKASREQGRDASAPAGADQPLAPRQRQEVPQVIPRRTKLVARKSLTSRPLEPASPPPEPAAHVSLDPKQAYERKWKVGIGLSPRMSYSRRLVAVLSKQARLACAR